MPVKSMLVVGLVALSACAGCASSMTATTGTSAEGQAAAGTPGSDTAQCGGGTFYNRASGLCVGPGGP